MIRHGVMCLALVSLSACEDGVIGTGSGAPDLLVECQFEVSPQGSYEAPAGVAVPTVTPGIGGTKDGADALNACIRQKASAFGISNDPRPDPVVAPAPSPASKPSPSPVQSELPQTVAPARASQTPSCQKKGGVLIGGSSYCVGG